MVKSRTRKKSNKSQAVEQALAATTDYIKHWTNRELAKLQKEELNPVCIPTAEGYRIGLYFLTVNPNKTCDVFDYNHEFIHRFESKISAILYSIYTIKKKYWIAEQLVQLDTVINKNYMDSLSLQRVIDAAHKRQDFTTVDIKQIRLEIAQKELTAARAKIAKIHQEAKYLKVWE